jgi:hypothetical protein
MLQRSPLIFWLLVAATVSLDAIAASLLASQEATTFIYAPLALHALILAQLGVVCIWSETQLAASFWSRAAPLIATVAAALISALIDASTDPRESIRSNFAMHGLYAALLIALLWLLQRTAFWRRRTGMARELQYSVAHLLVGTTVIAILAAAMRNSPFLGDELVVNIAFVFSSVALAIANTFIWSVAWHWLLRLAAGLGVAILLGMTFPLLAVTYTEMSDFFWLFSIMVGSHYLIQAIVLSLWLGCGPILPVARHDGELTTEPVP